MALITVILFLLSPIGIVTGIILLCFKNTRKAGIITLCISAAVLLVGLAICSNLAFH